MTENPIVKIANKIRDKVGTTQKFTLPEMASLVSLPDNFPDFTASLTLTQNGATKGSTDTLNVNGGDTISFTYTYTVTQPNLLRKLVGSKAKLSISCPVVQYMDTDFLNKSVAQTINFLKQDGSELCPAVTINAGETSYAYTSYYLNQQLTNAIVDYLVTNRPIVVTYDHIGSHANATVSGAPAACRLLLF